MMKESIAFIVIMSMISSTGFLSGCVQQEGNEVHVASGILRLLIKDKPGDYTILHTNVTISLVEVHKAGIINETENLSSGGAFNVSADGPYEADVGEDIQFLGEASGGQEPYNWSWDFGDENISYLQSPKHNYSLKGVYIANLTVTDDNTTTAWNETIAYIDQEEEDNDSGWFTIVNESQTFDLLALQNVTALLGEENLSVGKYTQIRLSIESAEITINRSGNLENYTLKVPSEKIKLIHPFLISENEITVLILDFIVDKSIHETGNGTFIMKPTIKIIQG